MRHAFACAGALLLALSGCSSPDPTYYVLTANPGTPRPGPEINVEIRRPGLAGYLDRSDIVLKSADYRLAVNSQVRWAEPLGDMIGRILAQDLSQRLPGSSIYTEAGAISADPTMRVEVDILGFDADATGQAVLTAEVVVELGTTHKPLSTRHVSMMAAPAGAGAGNLAASLSELLGRMSDQLAGDIRNAGAGS